VNASSVDDRMKRAGNLEPPDGRSGRADQLRGCGTVSPTVGMILVFGSATSGRSSAETTMVCWKA